MRLFAALALAVTHAARQGLAARPAAGAGPMGADAVVEMMFTAVK